MVFIYLFLCKELKFEIVRVLVFYEIDLCYEIEIKFIFLRWWFFEWMSWRLGCFFFKFLISGI